MCNFIFTCNLTFRENIYSQHTNYYFNYFLIDCVCLITLGREVSHDDLKQDIIHKLNEKENRLIEMEKILEFFFFILRKNDADDSHDCDSAGLYIEL